MLPLEQIKSEIVPHQIYNGAGILVILGNYERALLEHIEQMKVTHHKEYKRLNETKGTEFEKGDANGAFWALAELRGWIEAQ